MSRYEVQINLRAAVWVDVEADSEAEAEDYARETYRIGDAQWMEITDVAIMEYLEGAT